MNRADHGKIIAEVGEHGVAARRQPVDVVAHRAILNRIAEAQAPILRAQPEKVGAIQADLGRRQDTNWMRHKGNLYCTAQRYKPRYFGFVNFIFVLRSRATDRKKRGRLTVRVIRGL